MGRGSAPLPVRPSIEDDMKVSEYIDYLITGECSKLAIASVGDMSANPSPAPTAVQLVNQNKFINYINLANLALHKRFHLLLKTYEMDNPLNGEEFALPSDFLVPIHAYYSSDYEEVSIKDDSVKLVSDIDEHVSIIINEPFKAVIKGTDSKDPKRAQILLKYAAAPKKAKATYTDLKINEVYTEALLNYSGYKAHSAISGDMKDENNTYYLRYEASCKQLINSGMWGNNEIEVNTKLNDNGFV
tara:strand:+ start:244 stop:975 length:732 start_codon:yes stop_codon:yes gene_type:complete